MEFDAALIVAALLFGTGFVLLYLACLEAAAVWLLLAPMLAVLAVALVVGAADYPAAAFAVGLLGGGYAAYAWGRGLVEMLCGTERLCWSAGWVLMAGDFGFILHAAGAGWFAAPAPLYF